MSQFRARPQDLPEFASHSWGKVFFQFKSFAYQQTRFMKRSIADESAEGHFGRGLRNLQTLAALFPLAGEAVKSLRDWLTGRERESEGLPQYLENIAAAGALGLPWDLIEGAQRRKLLDTVAGPSAGMAADFGEIVLAKPLDAEAWKKFTYRHAPLGAIGRNVMEGREKCHLPRSGHNSLEYGPEGLQRIGRLCEGSVCSFSAAPRPSCEAVPKGPFVRGHWTNCSREWPIWRWWICACPAAKRLRSVQRDSEKVPVRCDLAEAHEMIRVGVLRSVKSE